jgi:hypothetical protein
MNKKSSKKKTPQQKLRRFTHRVDWVEANTNI